MPKPRLLQIWRSALNANKPSVTSMKLTVPNVDSNSSATFEFADMRRVFRARCLLGKILLLDLIILIIKLTIMKQIPDVELIVRIQRHFTMLWTKPNNRILPLPFLFFFFFPLETDLLGKQITIEASLMTCTNLRRDPTKPFQSIRSLMDDGKSESRKKKTASFNKISDGGFSSCLWSSSITLESPQKQNIVDFEIPIGIDPTVRRSCLHEWPNPTPIPHCSRNCILNFTSEGPLYEYKVLLVVSVYRGTFCCVID